MFSKLVDFCVKYVKIDYRRKELVMGYTYIYLYVVGGLLTYVIGTKVSEDMPTRSEKFLNRVIIPILWPVSVPLIGIGILWMDIKYTIMNS